MKRTFTAIAATGFVLAIGFAALEAATAGPRIDPGKVQPNPGIKPLQPKPGLLHAQCATHFRKQGRAGQQSYTCNFSAKIVCAPGMVAGRAVMKVSYGVIHVSYPCYEPPR